MTESSARAEHMPLSGPSVHTPINKAAGPSLPRAVRAQLTRRPPPADGPGVGMITVAVFLAQTGTARGDINRLTSRRQLGGLLGLGPAGAAQAGTARGDINRLTSRRKLVGFLGLGPAGAAMVISSFGWGRRPVSSLGPS